MKLPNGYGGVVKLPGKRSKIQEIAHDVGYTDSSHFIVMFKKLTGMTPAQFRRQ